MLRHTLKIWILVLVSFLSWGSVQAADANNNKLPRAERTQMPAVYQQMADRVYEIQKMDISALSGQERKNLKQELRAIKQEMKAIQGIYLSVGAIIIIILLLILIL